MQVLNFNEKIIAKSLLKFISCGKNSLLESRNFLKFRNLPLLQKHLFFKIFKYRLNVKLHFSLKKNWISNLLKPLICENCWAMKISSHKKNYFRRMWLKVLCVCFLPIRIFDRMLNPSLAALQIISNNHLIIIQMIG